MRQSSRYSRTRSTNSSSRRCVLRWLIHASGPYPPSDRTVRGCPSRYSDALFAHGKQSVRIRRRERDLVAVDLAAERYVNPQLRCGLGAKMQNPVRASRPDDVFLESPGPDLAEEGECAEKFDFPAPFGPIRTLIGPEAGARCA